MRTMRASTAVVLATAAVMALSSCTPGGPEPPDAAPSTSTSPPGAAESPREPHQSYRSTNSFDAQLPTPWTDGASWVIEDAVVGTYGLDTGIAALSEDGIMTVYDRRGGVVSQSEEPRELAPDRTRGTEVAQLYEGGKKYLAVFTQGTPPEAEGASPSPGALTVVITVFDGANGELLHRTLHTLSSDGDEHTGLLGHSGSLYLPVAEAPLVFDPVSGEFETVEVPDGDEWVLRVDGVDVFNRVDDLVDMELDDRRQQGYEAFTGQWRHEGFIAIPNAVGPYINLAIGNGGVATDKCLVVNVHSGESIGASERLNNGCLRTGSNHIHGFNGLLFVGHRGNGFASFEEGTVLVAMFDPETQRQWVENADPRDTESEDFRPYFVGADRIVYGKYSAPETSEGQAASYDPALGTEPRTWHEGNKTVLPAAVSGDGIGAFPDLDGNAMAYIVKPEAGP
ncbi:hypothetical protein [Arthrobacter crystallopoietes]|uniref:hypothetical protein n=1 Tax=Crystallibacter crystallopoietes TaxID=37928 RepID=UPI001ABE7120|nr:hypothetical protein [Arthrobacter crystallopoietes]QTG79601.1 hypothetical protein J5251_11685 [Arthrobacter crystallopoietes]